MIGGLSVEEVMRIVEEKVADSVNGEVACSELIDLDDQMHRWKHVVQRGFGWNDAEVVDGMFERICAV